LLFFLTPAAGVPEAAGIAMSANSMRADHPQDLVISHSTQKRMDGTQFSDHGKAPPITLRMPTKATPKPTLTSLLLP